MSKQKHSPLPWVVDSWNRENIFYHDDSKGFDGAEWIANCEKPSNAQFIVTACNYHYKLVEALKDIIGYPAGPDDFHERQQKGYRLLKELEESCKEK